VSRTYRAGVIGRTGQGNYGHGLDLVWTGLAGVEVVGVADPDADGRAAALARSGAQRGYADFHDLLEKEHLDLVSVGPRWPDCHADMMIAAIEAGARGIFCEKPFAATLAEADAMLAAADRAGAKITLGLQHRVMRVVQEMRRIVQSGELGEIREVRGRPTIGPRGGSFLLTVLGTHVLDLMRYLAGDPAWAFGRITTREGREVDARDAREAAEAYGLLAGDAVGAIYGFGNGVTGFCDSYHAPTVPEGSLAVEVWGTEGVVALRSSGSGRQLYRWQASSGRPIQELTHVPVAGWDDDPRMCGPRGLDLDVLNHQLARDLIAAIEEDRQPDVSGADGRWAMEMIFGAHESQLTGRRVPLPCEQRENPYRARRVSRRT